MVLGNGLALAETVLACLRVGKPVVLFDPRLGLEEALPLVATTAPGLIVTNAETQDLGGALAAEVDGESCAHAGLAAAARSSARDTPSGVDLERTAVVVFSSGTSGTPKPIELTAGNLLWSALASASRLGSRPEDRWLACLPLSHMGGLSILFRSVLLGTTMQLHRGFDLAAVRAALAGEGTTMVSLVPTTLARLIDEVKSGVVAAPALRCALIGGASAPIELLEEARRSGLPVAPTYGLTETASQVATLAPGEPFGETGRVGPPLLPTEVSIVGADGRDVEAGVVGGIRIRGATVSATALEEDGWLHTGDAGRLDSVGVLTALGRQDDVIITGGENVSPGEVEAVLGRLPGIAEVAVAGVADPQWGQVVGAWVVPSPGASISLEGLREACGTQLAPHKRPRWLTLADSLPRTALGKIRRNLLGGR